LWKAAAVLLLSNSISSASAHDATRCLCPLSVCHVSEDCDRDGVHVHYLLLFQPLMPLLLLHIGLVRFKASLGLISGVSMGHLKETKQGDLLSGFQSLFAGSVPDPAAAGEVAFEQPPWPWV
jgi:hypothetical protein